MIRLENIVDALERTDDTTEQFLNIKTGEIVFIDSLYGDDNDEELLEETEFSDNYVILPNQYEINEFEIMKNFAFSVEDNLIKEKLLNVLNHRHPFRNFKDQIWVLGIREDYFKFRENAYYNIAKNGVIIME